MEISYYCFFLSSFITYGSKSMKLEVYNKNYNKLLKYAESSSIKVVYLSTNSEAEWSKESKTIRINSEHYGNTKELALFLHELGHCIDDFRQSKEFLKQSSLSYKHFNRVINNQQSRMSSKTKYCVIETEFRAWNNGISLAKQLGIRLGKWFYKEMDQGIKAYFTYAFKTDKEFISYRKEKGWKYV